MGRELSRPELGAVIEALLGSVTDTGGLSDPVSGAGVVVTEAEITVPLEGLLARGADGRPVLLASPPRGLMRTGFDRPTHHAHLHLVLEGD